MGNKNFGRIVVLLLIACLSTCCLLSGTMAAYNSYIDGSAVGTVATWNFSVDGFGDVTTPVELSGAGNDYGLIVPGSYGIMPFVIDASGSQVDVDYAVVISNLSGKPANLKFYADYDYENGEFINEITEADGYTMAGTIHATDQPNGDHLIPDALELFLFWKWDFETLDADGDPAAGNAQDTLDASNIMTFDVTISGKQAAG